MKLKPLKVNLKSLLAFQKEYEEKWSKDFDAVSYLENSIIKDKTYVKISKRIKKINNIFNN